MGITSAILNAVGTRADVKESLTIVMMKGRKPGEMVWCIVKRMGPSEQVVGLDDLQDLLLIEEKNKKRVTEKKGKMRGDSYRVVISSTFMLLLLNLSDCCTACRIAK